MKNLITNSAYAVPIMLTMILIGATVWMEYRPEIQDALRTAQNLIFWWQR